MRGRKCGTKSSASAKQCTTTTLAGFSVPLLQNLMMVSNRDVVQYLTSTCTCARVVLKFLYSSLVLEHTYLSACGHFCKFVKSETEQVHLFLLVICASSTTISDCAFSLSVLTANLDWVSRCLLKQRMMEVVVTTGLLKL